MSHILTLYTYKWMTKISLKIKRNGGSNWKTIGLHISLDLVKLIYSSLIIFLRLIQIHLFRFKWELTVSIHSYIGSIEFCFKWILNSMLSEFFYSFLINLLYHDTNRFLDFLFTDKDIYFLEHQSIYSNKTLQIHSIKN